jgi:predicted SAM-dependent methyltransferase
MKSQLKTWLKAAGLYETASRGWIALEPRLIRSSRAIIGRDRQLIDRYVAAHHPRKLHIGCGDNQLQGWLNTELCPRGDQVFLDAARPFPLADRTFHFVYAEHMIEHIGLADADAMVAECRRVMAPGGILRLVTPDLAFLTALLDTPPPPRLGEYIRHSIESHRIYAPDSDGVSVFNNFVRAWGHQYIHNEASLRSVMTRAGFTDVRRLPLNDSPHPELAGLAKVDRMPAGFLEMESFVLEGTKPDGGD